MYLQKRMLKIIEEKLGGQCIFIGYLEKCQRQALPSDKSCFDFLLYYMNAMYEFEVDFEGDTLKYLDHHKKTKDENISKSTFIGYSRRTYREVQRRHSCKSNRNLLSCNIKSKIK